LSDVVSELITAQRKRLLASILGHAEREIYPDLTPEQQGRFRDKVLTSVGVFSDFTLDCVRAANKDWTVNEDAMRVLHHISNQVTKLGES
jgi:hypothetical protein